MESLIKDLIADSLEDQTASSTAAARSEQKARPGPVKERLEPGSRLGAYEIKRWLGAGGTGDVYLAEHVRLGRRVAIKRLRSEMARDRKALRRFFDEARAVNRIRHRNIVEITDLTSDGRDVYCVMELLEGTTLAALEYRGGMHLNRVLDIAIQICDALAAVHAAGIVHRDLKPQNVILVEHRGQKDRVKLLDFGIAKLRDIDRQLSGDTTGNVALGTPGYMAPEQLLGGHVDHRADLYALGVILYQMATGTNPFIADTWGQAVVKHATEVPARPSRLPGAGRKLPAELEELILRCLEKTPQKRPKSATEVGAVLERLRASDAQSSRRLRWLIPAVVGIVGIVSAGTLLALGSGRHIGGDTGATRRTSNATEPSSRQVIVEPPVAAPLAVEQRPAAQPDERPPRPAAALRDAPEASQPTVAEPAVDPPAPAPAPAPTTATTSAQSPDPALITAASQAEKDYAAGRELLRQGKALLAITRLEACIAANPRHARAYRLLGKAHAMLGREASAIGAFEEFLALEPSHRDAPKLRRIIAEYRERTTSSSADGTEP
jgi:serine/threonine protein kinase